MKKLRSANITVSQHSLFLLRVCFLITLIELALIVADMQAGNYRNQLYAARLFYKMVEYIMLDITVTVGGAFLFDLAVRDFG